MVCTSASWRYRPFFPFGCLYFKATFARRAPALVAARINYKVTDDSASLELEHDLASYSEHQQDVIRFTRNPLDGLRFFGGLDLPVAQAVIQALKETSFDNDGSWKP